MVQTQTITCQDTVIEGKLDKERLAEVLKALVKRHDSFRTSFEMIEGELIQRIHKDVDFKIVHLKAEEAKSEGSCKGFHTPV